MQRHVEVDNLVYNPVTGKLFYRRVGILKPCSESLSSGGYLRAYYKGKRIEQHRLAYFMMTGCWPNIIDHINHDKTDNRWVNLRNVNHSINGYNRKDKYAGVSFCNTRNKWRATDCQRHLGYFESKKEALCRKQKERSCAD